MKDIYRFLTSSKSQFGGILFSPPGLRMLIPTQNEFLFNKKFCCSKWIVFFFFFSNFDFDFFLFPAHSSINLIYITEIEKKMFVYPFFFTKSDTILSLPCRYRAQVISWGKRFLKNIIWARRCCRILDILRDITLLSVSLYFYTWTLIHHTGY